MMMRWEGRVGEGKGEWREGKGRKCVMARCLLKNLDENSEGKVIFKSISI